MEVPAEPSSENDFLAPHVDVLLESYLALTGRRLIATGKNRCETAQALYEAPFIVLSHDGSVDPILTYGNLAAQQLFSMNWEEIVRTPSRFTAETPEREERQRLLDAVSARGFIDDYSGVRVSADGSRFIIRQATVWNLSAATGKPTGQAATFCDWEKL
ncbi:MEKHLA domain-containing protein [Luteolibacter algae]|uniref:MEKHLA domain-containing protein n=1 Tax=Luteolibacter algae TaxID=454151 RepID=A0ABW5D3W9_9BACT